MVDESCLRYLHQLQKKGVVIHDLPAVGLTNETVSKATQDFITTLRDLVGVPRHDTAFRGVRSVTICQGTCSPQFLALIFAIQASQSVQTVRIKSDWRTTYEYSRKSWQAIAYTLFCSPRTMHVTKLEIECSYISQADVSVLAEVLAARDPLQEVMGTRRKCNFGSVTSAKFFLDENASDPKAIVLPHPAVVAVIDKPTDGKMWPVLLPGWCKAWVEPPEPGLYLPSESYFSASSRCDIRQLVVTNRTTGALVAIVSLIELIGCNLEHLEVVNDVIEDWSFAAISTCPKLTSLLLRDVMIENVETLVQHLARCKKLTNLAFRIPTLERCVGQMTLFFVALDASDPAFIDHLGNLEKLSVCLHVSQNSDLCQLSSLKKMLLVNRRLHTVTVDIHTHPYVTVTVNRVVQAIQRDQDSIRTWSLSYDQKLAFISVVDHFHGADSCLSDVCCGITQLIFVYAQSPRAAS